jgi:DNA repair exonuclease SbcCD ATPase subunit
MRITRLKLVNFIGIKHGMGRDEIEIKFPTDGKNRITMIAGQNGSGKSTIMSQLQPYKDSFDDRSVLIVEHREGRKEIDILGDDGSTKYTIQHIYPADLKETGATVSCFIQEDGVELNPSGTVRSFEDVVKAKFGITKDYFQIGKVGTNTQSFINLTTTERKEFFSRLIPSVEKYQAAYDEATSKFKASKDRVSDIGASLRKYADRKSIEAAISDANGKIKQAEASSASLTGRKAVLESKNAELSEAMAKADYASAKERLRSDDAKLAAYAAAQSRFEADYSGMSVSDCIKKKSALEAAIAKDEADSNAQAIIKNNSASVIAACENDSASARLKLEGMATGDLKAIGDSIDTDEDRLKSASNIMMFNPFASAVFSSEDGRYDERKGIRKDFQYSLSRFEEFMSYAESHHKDLNAFDIRPDKTNVESFFGEGFAEVYMNQAKARREALEGRQSLIEAKNSEYGVKSANIEKLSILEKRPKACSIDDCPFIKDALAYANLPQELSLLDKEITDAKALLKEDQTAADRLSDVGKLHDEFVIYYGAMKPRDNPVLAYFVAQSRKSLAGALGLPLNDLRALAEKTVASAKEAIEGGQAIADLTESVARQKSRFASISESEKTRQYLNAVIADKTASQSAEAKKLAAASEEIARLSSDKAASESALKETEEYISSKTESEGVRAEAESLRSVVSDYEAKDAAKKANDAELGTIASQMRDVESLRSSLQGSVRQYEAAIANIDALDKELASVKGDYSDRKTIRDSLDPRKGIPLLFVQAYLGQTEKIANDLLDLAYGGRFKILFVPTDKDFFIKVIEGSNTKDDITLASQGEIAMTTVSISLALIEQSMGRFNSVCLDEIDGPLDSSNRRSFISILKSQIDKMGIEQVFVISHNDAFDAESMDLIILPGSGVDREGEFMANKRVVFDCDAQ